jgi:acyl carrier protein
MEDRIKAYISRNLTYAGETFDADASLVGAGIIDSVGVLELVAFLQSEFGIEILQPEVTLDNFDTVNRMAGFVRAKDASKTAAGAAV